MQMPTRHWLTNIVITTTSRPTASSSGTSKPKVCKKPNFIGFSNDKIKAGIADKLELDHLSIPQLKHLEKDIIMYHVGATMSEYVLPAMETLIPFDFLSLLSTAIDLSNYITTSADTSDKITHVVEDRF